MTLANNHRMKWKDVEYAAVDPGFVFDHNRATSTTKKVRSVCQYCPAYEEGKREGKRGQAWLEQGELCKQWSGTSHEGVYYDEDNPHSCAINNDSSWVWVPVHVYVAMRLTHQGAT